MASASAAASLEQVECASASQVTCYRASLPLDIAAPGNGSIEMAVAVVDNGDPRGIGPVVFLQGGPGIGAVDAASRFVGLEHDVVLFDQRGTGDSVPKLDCPEVSALWVAERSDGPDRVDDETVFAAYAACGERLSESVDLSMFHTEAVAADVELLRGLLDYEPWSLWGASYGTRIGQTIMQNHPAGVRAAVLDSAVPFEADFFATLPEHAVRAFEELDAACDRSSCVDAYGDFGSNLEQLVAQLDESPVVVEVARPVSGDPMRFQVGGSELLDMVFSQLYSTSQLRALPRQVARAEFGGLEELAYGYLRRRDPERLDLAIGVYYSTWCREEFPFHDPTADDAFLAETANAFSTALDDALAADSIGRLCGYFDVPAAPPVLDTPVASGVPALVFAGQFDPITPPEWSAAVAQALDNSVFVTFPDHGHGMSGQGASGVCATLLRYAFLQNPTAELDVSCVEPIGDPVFE